MAITDLQISDTLQTSAPSIKYTGNEGPQDPRMMRGRRMAAGGGIMGSNNGSMLAARTADGSRPKYGFLDRVRKLIPNEIARVAEKAAPFVAPFNPIAAGLMGGIGSFDRTGNLGGAFKSGLMNYGGGQLARGIGGGFGNLQTGFDPRGGMQGMGSGLTKYFSNPMQKTGGLGKMFADKSTTSFTQDGGNKFTQFTKDITNPADTAESLKLAKETAPKNIKLLDKFLGKVGLNTAAMAGIVGASALAGIYTAKNPADNSIEQMRGEGLDVESIRTEVVEAFKDPSGKKLEAIRIKYPFLGAKETKNIDIMAEGGRIGLYAGGVPSPYSMEDARKTSMQDKMGGITDVMKRADLYRAGDVGQMYRAQGGRIGYDDGGPTYKNFEQFMKEREQMYRGMDKENILKDWKRYKRFKQYGQEAIQEAAQGGRIGAQEGGLMNLGGMEKDYRNEGGFVALGGKEKADDVPARLSKNEFVFTADAVRGAGGGDIDKGAEIMENIMTNLEQGGRMSKGSQGLGGAQEMFDVSERLGEVI